MTTFRYIQKPVNFRSTSNFPTFQVLQIVFCCIMRILLHIIVPDQINVVKLKVKHNGNYTAPRKVFNSSPS